MKEEQAVTEKIRAQHAAGRKVASAVRKYVNVNERVRNIVQDYPNRQRLHFLRAIAHNLNY
jgi:hypothetical protein